MQVTVVLMSNVPIATRQPLRYGVVITMESQFVMLVVCTISCTTLVDH